MSINTLHSKLKPQEKPEWANLSSHNALATGHELFTPGARNLSVVIPPRHAPNMLVKHMAKKEQRLGRNVLYYTLNDEIVSSDSDLTLENFSVLAKKMKDTVEWSSADRIRWIGSGLGAAILMRAVGGEALPADEITLNAPAGDLAVSIWTSKQQSLRKEFESQGVGLDELQDKWRAISPLRQAQNITGSSITLHVSMADTTNRPGSAYQLAEALDEANDVSLYVNRSLRHTGTILAYS